MVAKCTAVLTAKVPPEMADAWKRLARQADCSPMELLRDLISLNLHGVTFGELEVKDRRAALGVQPLSGSPNGHPVGRSAVFGPQLDLLNATTGASK